MKARINWLEKMLYQVGAGQAQDSCRHLLCLQAGILFLLEDGATRPLREIPAWMRAA